MMLVGSMVLALMYRPHGAVCVSSWWVNRSLDEAVLHEHVMVTLQLRMQVEAGVERRTEPSCHCACAWAPRRLAASRP